MLKENGLELSIEKDYESNDTHNVYITEQIPNAGISVKKGSNVYIKCENKE